jgi:hypothetical protein
MPKSRWPIMQSSEAREEITIGVVGGADVVRRVVTVAREGGSPSWRLVPSVYAEETDAFANAAKIAPRVDVCLFAGPFPYDIAIEHGDLPVPATFIPVGGSALYAALLRGTVSGTFDPQRITVDTVSEPDVAAAYSEAQLSSADVRVMPYDRPESAERFLEFHRTTFERGASSGAITTVPTVATALAEAGVPSLMMRATAVTVRHALHTAALMGSGARLEESRIVTMVVRMPDSVVPVHTSSSNYWYQDLKLSLQRELLREARTMDAAVLPRDERSFLVITTMGSVAAATDDLTVAPFLGRVAAELNLDLEVGIGFGRSTREAESNAQSAVDKAAATAGATAYLVGPRETVLQLPASRHTEPDQRPTAPAGDTKAIETLRRLAVMLDDERDSDQIVDAERVAVLLGVTLRTARRTLHHLVDEGLAWPMPPAKSSKVGRPPRPYQLLIEKLPGDVARRD